MKAIGLTNHKTRSKNARVNTCKVVGYLLFYKRLVKPHHLKTTKYPARGIFCTTA